jgi:hypothetical protein
MTSYFRGGDGPPSASTLPTILDWAAAYEPSGSEELVERSGPVGLH